MEQKFLPDEVYAQALESFVVVCTDVVPINRSRRTIYLARRAVKPMQGWWWIGGRMFAGEHEQESVKRCFRRETSLDLPSERFEYVAMYRYWWKDRKQEPQDKGADDLSYTFVVELTSEELRKVSHKLDKKEYAQGGLQEFDRERLSIENVHPAILDLYNRVFQT